MPPQFLNKETKKKKERKESVSTQAPSKHPTQRGLEDDAASCAAASFGHFFCSVQALFRVGEIFFPACSIRAFSAFQVKSCSGIIIF